MSWVGIYYVYSNKLIMNDNFRKHRERKCPKCDFMYFSKKEYVTHIYNKHSY